MINNPFTNKNHSINATHREQHDMLIHEVDILLQETAYNQSTTVCYLCKSKPLYKLVAKHAHLANMELEKIGYVCQTCVTKIDITQYRTIKLEGI